jgi:hypothetical protein
MVRNEEEKSGQCEGSPTFHLKHVDSEEFQAFGKPSKVNVE